MVQTTLTGGDDTIFPGLGEDNSGDDSIIGSGTNDSIDGGDGNDTLNGGVGGNDTIDGGQGDDSIFGGSGADTIIFSGGIDTIDGGLDFDTLDLSAFNDRSGDIVFEEGFVLGDVFFGGNGDLSDGSFSGALQISFLDELTGDVEFSIVADSIEEVILDETLRAAEGDRLFGFGGNDLIVGDDLQNEISGGIGNDTVVVSAGNDVLTGGDGDDTLDFSNFSDATVTGDLATGLTITLADGSIQTANGFEEIIGLDPVDPGTPDVLASTGEDETLDGGAGDDTITYTTGGGSDSIIGGADTDTLIVSGDDTGNTVSLANEAGESSSLELEVDGATSTVEEVEDITINTGAGGDTVTTSGTLTDAGVSQNTITVDLGDGADTFIVGGANVTHDEIDGGAGDDTLSLTDDVANTLGVFDATDLASLTSDGTVSVAEDGTVSFDLGDASYTASNFESIEINGTTFSLTEEEPVPDNVITGNDRGNLLISGSGNDSLVGNGGNDWMFGNSGNDTLDGGSGNDLMFGGSGDDSLDGGEGCDILFAGSGDDTLDGGSGLNILSGGRGNDTFKFTFGEAGKNTTFITDFGRGDDQLVLTDQNGQAVGSYDELKEIAEITQGRFGDLTIDFGNDVLVISNFSEDELKNLFAGFDVA